MKLEHSITINAPLEKVWALNTDIANWPSLMTTVTSVKRLDDGPLHPGSSALLKQPGQRPTVWTVTDVEPHRFFAWNTKTVGMSMRATHTLVQTGDAVTNTLGIEMSGGLAAIIGRIVSRSVRKVIKTENESFKRAAETV